MSRPSSLITTIVRAGAGTGKTESLARRIIDVAFELHAKTGFSPRLVATTFTERATAELRERVVTIAANLSDAPGWISDFVQDGEKLQISTIHGTFSLMLHRYGMLIGLDPEFTIMPSGDEGELLRKCMRDIISLKNEFGVLVELYSFKDLSYFVNELISHFRLHGKNFQPSCIWKNILSEQGQDLLDVLHELNDIPSGDLSEKTANKIATLKGLYFKLKIISVDSIKFREIFLNELADFTKPALRQGGQGFELKPYIDKVYEIRESFQSESFNPQINLRYEEISVLLGEFAKIVQERLENEKKSQGVLTFNDLEFLTLDLIEKHPHVLQKIKQDCDFWFVDEYQDTSPIQKKILFYFLQNHWNAYFVGDPQQSIYLFRGADARVFQDTLTEVTQKGGIVERLTTNYRSHPDLLKFINHLFLTLVSPLEPLLPKSEFQDQVRSHLHLCTDVVNEENIVVQQVSEWRIKGYDFHDIAVLVKTNEKARDFGRALSQAGVPVFVHSAGGYYDRREVLDALSILSFLEDPSDDEIFVILARSPWLGISDEKLSEWGQKRAKQSYWEWLNKNQIEWDEYKTLKFLGDAVNNSQFLPLSLLFEDLVRKLGLFEFCLLEDASGQREANLRKLLAKLRNEESKPGFSASRFLEQAWLDLSELGEENQPASFVEPKRVNIMTVHKSKGLKFNCVIVPSCSDAMRVRPTALVLNPNGKWAIRVLALDSEERVAPLDFEHLRDLQFQSELSEGLRVFYVAVTRAAEELALIGNIKIAPKSWFSNVSLDWSEGTHDGIYTVKHWSQTPELTIDKTEAKATLPKNFKLGSPPLLGEEKFSVTEVLGKNNKTPFSLTQQIESQRRGQAIHYIFENYKDFPIHSPSHSIERLTQLAKEKFGGTWKIDNDAIVKMLKSKNPPLEEIIRNGQTEWPFEFRDSGFIFNGQIDLWGKWDGFTWVIDYKSAKNMSQETLDKAHEQLELYALALHKSGFHWDKFKLAVLAPLEGKVHELPLRSLDEVRRNILELLG